jgi:hypothetical protein
MAVPTQWKRRSLARRIDMLAREVYSDTNGAGSPGHDSIAALEGCCAGFHQTVLTCTATPLVLTDDAGVAVYGGVKVYDFPAGLLLIFGAVIDGSITAVQVLATFDGDVALGTATATTGATLVSTEADIMPSVELTTAVAKVANCDAVSAATALTESGARWFDGTTTAKDMYLNFVIDEDAANDTSTGSFTGTIEFMWAILGDK